MKTRKFIDSDEIELHLLTNAHNRTNEELKAQLAVIQSDMVCHKRFKKCTKAKWPVGIATFFAGAGTLVFPLLDSYRQITKDIEAHRTIQDEILSLYQNRSLHATLFNITCPAPNSTFWNHPEYDVVPICISAPCYYHFFRQMRDYCGFDDEPFFKTMIAMLDEICKNLFENFCHEESTLSRLDLDREMSVGFYGWLGLIIISVLSCIIPFAVKKCLDQSEITPAEQANLDRHHIPYDPRNLHVTLALVEERKNYVESYQSNEERYKKIRAALPQFPVSVCDIISVYTHCPTFFSKQCRTAFLDANWGQHPLKKQRQQTPIVRFFHTANTHQKEESRAIVDKIFEYASI